MFERLLFVLEKKTQPIIIYECYMIFIGNVRIRNLSHKAFKKGLLHKAFCDVMCIGYIMGMCTPM